jgi:hypothetical protein
MRCVQLRGSITTLILWSIVTFGGSSAASAQELSEKVKMVISTALADVCSPVVRDNASFKEALTNSDPQFEDISKPGTDQAIYRVNDTIWVAVSQNTDRKDECSLLVGTKRNMVRPVFRHTINTWGCRPRTIGEVKDRRMMVQCPDTRIKIAFYLNGEDNVITGFLFGLKPEDDQSKNPKQDQ